jgi:hypothetical protein
MMPTKSIGKSKNMMNCKLQHGKNLEAKEIQRY